MGRGPGVNVVLSATIVLKLIANGIYVKKKKTIKLHRIHISDTMRKNTPDSFEIEMLAKLSKQGNKPAVGLTIDHIRVWDTRVPRCFIIPNNSCQTA